jgi:glycosyltransferase involved in cell wall biosynthesis
VPSQHPYVRAVCDPSSVSLLPDPLPPGAEPGRWWPPQILDAGWIRTNADRFDVLHLHFGAESFPAEHVADALRAAASVGKPVVYTVHDLENPQLFSQTEHERMLGAVIPVADVVMTLTDTARDGIAARWGRSALVVPHPRVWDASEEAPIGHPHSTVRVGTHLRDLRPNIDGLGVTRALAAAVAAASGDGRSVRATIHLNERVRDEAQAARVESLAAESEGVEVVRSPRLSDAELAEMLADLDACVLPYAHGTHSGWLELCHDLGVPVVGPMTGHFGAQHPGEYTSYDLGDASSLWAAIARAILPEWSAPGSPARAAEVAARATRRASQLVEIRAVHTEIYRSLLRGQAAA